MDTVAIVEDLLEERNLTMYKLSVLCDISYSTLKNTKARQGQLTIDTIEKICHGLGITVAEFFAGRG